MWKRQHAPCTWLDEGWAGRPGKGGELPVDQPSDDAWSGPLLEQFRAMELRRDEAVPYACTHAWSYEGWAARSGEDGELILELFSTMEQRRGR